MDEFIKVIILGVVEGITEFLPISSTGHLLVTSAIINPEIATRLGGTFELFIQVGAVLAVVAYYWRDLVTQVRTVRHDQNVQKLWMALVVASIPAAVLGFALRDFIKETLFPKETAPTVVGITLILGGLVFLIIERRRNVQVTTTELSQISLKQALIIGLAQSTALIPGVSRSGASIIGAMLVGVSRSTATAFSFYLAIPVLGGATVLDLLLSLDEIHGNDFVLLLVGTIISGVVAWVAIRWLLNYVASNDFIPFGYYRIIVGALLLLLVVANVL